LRARRDDRGVVFGGVADNRDHDHPDEQFCEPELGQRRLERTDQISAWMVVRIVATARITIAVVVVIG
jgi:hypothetical protein